MALPFLAAALLCAAGCGGAAAPGNGTGADAGADGGADAGPDGGPLSDGVERVDWRDVRGPPLSLAVAGVHEGTLFAAGVRHYTVQSACGEAAACDYTWHDSGGAQTARAAALSPVDAHLVSNDGKWMYGLLGGTEEECTVDGEHFYPVRSGTGALLDLETGSAALSEPGMRSRIFFEPSFSEYSRYLLTYPIVGVRCSDGERRHRALAAPFASTAAEAAGFFLSRELADGRFLADRDDEYGVIEPGSPSSFLPVQRGPVSEGRAYGYYHAAEGSPLQAVRSLDLQTGAASAWSLPWQEDDWVFDLRSDRWVVACSHATQPRRCLVHDARGEAPDRPLLVGYSRPDFLALAGTGSLLVYRAPDTGALRRLDLLTGEVTALAAAPGALGTFASASAVLVRQGGSLWVVERKQEALLVDDLWALVGIEGNDLPLDLPQRDLLVLVRGSASGAARYLSAYHHARGRLVRLTDRLDYAQPFQVPLFAASTCSVPWVTRSSGAGAQTALQPGRYLYFGDLTPGQGAVELAVLPVDLSAPPRALGRYPLEECPAPLASPDGKALAAGRLLPDGRIEVSLGALP